VNVAASACSETAPVAGAAGLAAVFDGIATCASLGTIDARAALSVPPSSSASSISAPSSLSARIAFKTRSKAAAGSTILALGPLRLGFTRLHGLSWGDISGTGGRVGAGSDYNDGAWHVAAVSASATDLAISVDGAPVRTSAWNGATLNWTSDVDSVLRTLEVVVGCAGLATSASSGTRFNGFVDELALWKGVAPAAATAAALVPPAVTYGGYRTPPSHAPLLARWRFDHRTSIGRPSFPSPAPAAMALTGSAPAAVPSSFAAATDAASVTEGAPATLTLQCSSGAPGVATALVGVITALPSKGSLRPVAADGVTIGTALTSANIPAYLDSTKVKSKP